MRNAIEPKQHYNIEDFRDFLEEAEQDVDLFDELCLSGHEPSQGSLIWINASRYLGSPDEYPGMCYVIENAHISEEHFYLHICW